MQQVVLNQRNLSIFVFSFLLFSLAQVLASHGPEGGSVLSIAIDPINTNTIYSGTYDNGGIFKSTDGGNSWLFKGLNNFSLIELVVDPINTTVLYACCLQGVGIFKSTDGGDNWAPLGFIAGRLAMDPSNSDIIYGITSQGVVKSTDGGTSWEPTGLAGESPFVIAIDSINTSRVYVGTEGRGIYKSEDAGESWTRYDISTPTNPRILSMIIDPQNPRILYAGGWEGLFKSTDGGESWRNIPIIFSVFKVLIDPSDSFICCDTGWCKI